MDQRHRSGPRRLAAVVVVVAVLGAGVAYVLRTAGPDDHEPEAHPASGTGGPAAAGEGQGPRHDGRQFVAALRAGDRAAALRNGRAEVYDELFRDEAGDTARARLQRCVRSPGHADWICGLDFPSTGPADGDAYSLTLSRSGSRWWVVSAAPVAG